MPDATDNPVADNQAANPPGAGQAPSADAAERLAQAEQQAQQHKDAWLRAVADADNARKRAQADVANAHKYAVEGFAGELLAVKDALEAALNAENSTLENMKNGVELTLKQLHNVFEKFNVRVVDPVGARFDPHQHQAITMVESAQHEPNSVVNVLQKGYLLNDRVLRPALVTVAKPPQA